MKHGRLLLASAACALCAALGSLLIYSESAALTYGVQGNSNIYDGIETRQVHLGYSYYSKKRVMLNCMDGMSSFSVLVRAAEQNERFANSCRDLASGILADSPLDGLAWAVTARAGAVLKDFVGMNRALAESWLATPNEQWLATIRVDIGEANYDLLDETVHANHLKDLGVLVLSQSGVAAIAKRYWDHPEFRERLTTAVSALPNDDQLRFLAYVRRAANK